MTTTTAAHTSPTSGASRCPDCTDGLGQPREVKPGSFRERVHANRSVALAWRIGVFAVGLLCVAIGFALAVLPGPLTIPPVLLGLWIWSTEFEWARRIFSTFSKKARDAWAHARAHPVSSLAITVGGLAAAGVAFWAVGHFELVDRTTTALGF